MLHGEIAVQSRNFKGVPNGWKRIQRVNFIVGENSAGKTSFLDLLSLLDSADFVLLSRILGCVPGLETAEDVITKYGDNKEITVGFLSRTDTEGELSTYSGKLVSYVRTKDGLALEAVTIFDRRSATKTRLKGRTFFSKRFDLEDEDTTFESACDLADRAHHDEGTGYSQMLAVTESAGYQDWFQATMFASMQLSKGYQGERRRLRTSAARLEGPPFGILRYGPIRGETDRLFLGSSEKEFDPSGSHYPFRLKKISEKGNTALDPIREFGLESGLFDDIRIQPLKGGKGGNAFSILFKKYGTEFYSNELGYGLGQIIPIVTDILTTKGDHTFLIQQPEVHLHPKAQAAFGSLLAKVSDDEISFVIETHSDFLIDRFRMEKTEKPSETEAQILFFHKPEKSSRPVSVPITIDGSGKTANMPDPYREFFVNEALDRFEKL